MGPTEGLRPPTGRITRMPCSSLYLLLVKPMACSYPLYKSLFPLRVCVVDGCLSPRKLRVFRSARQTAAEFRAFPSKLPLLWLKQVPRERSWLRQPN
jgi:hypothetical protein